MLNLLVNKKMKKIKEFRNIFNEILKFLFFLILFLHQIKEKLHKNIFYLCAFCIYWIVVGLFKIESRNFSTLEINPFCPSIFSIIYSRVCCSYEVLYIFLFFYSQNSFSILFSKDFWNSKRSFFFKKSKLTKGTATIKNTLSQILEASYLHVLLVLWIDF